MAGARTVFRGALVSLALGAAVASGATCASTGVEAPAVSTVVASRDSPRDEAWIVAPDCSFRRLSTKLVEVSVPWEFLYTTRPPGGDTWSGSVPGLPNLPSTVERIDSVPSSVRFFNADGLRLTRGADLTNADDLLKVVFAGNSFTSLSAIRLPDSVKQLHITNTGISSLRDFNWPGSLQYLTLGGPKLSVVDPSSPFPSGLKYLDISGTAVTALRGFKLPSSLQQLNVDGLNIGYVEVRDSDLSTLSQLKGLEGLRTQSSCDANARTQAVNGMTVCVISDTRFQELYALSSSNNVPSQPSNPGGGNGASTNTGDGSGGGESNRSPTSPNAKTTKPSKTSNATTASSSSEDGSASAGSMSESSKSASNSSELVNSAVAPAAAGQGSAASDEWTPYGPGRTASPGTSSKVDGKSNHESQSSSVSPLLMASLAVGALCVFALIMLGCRMLCRSKKPTGDDTHTIDSAKYTNMDGSHTTSSDAASTLDEILHDQALFAFHIDKTNIRVGELIARGGCGEIFNGVYQGRKVVVKQMMRAAWRDEARRADFAAEIRMCARLDHPRITEFVGITWANRHTVSIVLEFMEGADLHRHLEAQPGPCTNSWSQPWTSTASSTLKSKAEIAQDVAEAIVYLHSFQTPILHRDLKARNVLLTRRGDAKLSDFGISREIAVDETMTREIGTTAWIAPEVLRGKRYSEKADIYSLGVLLVEMDLCRHPFTTLTQKSLELVATSTTTNAAYQSAQLIVAIGNGELRPSVSSECPVEIRALVSECLAHSADSRPSAMEVFYRLRQIVRARTDEYHAVIPPERQQQLHN